HTAGACAAGGAAGVVLDAQLLLARESSLPEAARQRLAAFDGSETACLGERLGGGDRPYVVPGVASVGGLRKEEARPLNGGPSAQGEVWRQVVGHGVALDRARGLWLIGQDASFARPLAARYRTVGGIVQAVRERARRHLERGRTLQPLVAGAPLARRHGTRYPI